MAALGRHTSPVSAEAVAPLWSKPFSFTYRNLGCIVGARNFAIIVPSSQDPSQPVARHVKFVPSRFKLRPDFKTAFT